MRAVLALLLLGGCKQVFGIGDPTITDEDSGVVDDAGGDDAADAGPTDCHAKWIDGTVQLSAPTPVVSGPLITRAPHISTDELTIWFSAYSGTELPTVRRATRTSPTGVFGTAVVEPELTSDAGDIDVSLTADELNAVVSSDRDGPPASIYYSQRTATSQMFGSATTAQVATLNTNDKDEVDASLSADGLEIFSTRLGSGGAGVSMATRAARSANFGAAMTIDLGGLGSDYAPTLASDNRVLIFESDRGATTQLFYATRTARGQVFGSSQPVPLTPVLDRDGMLSSDGCTLYFVRGTLDGQGQISDSDILAARVIR